MTFKTKNLINIFVILIFVIFIITFLLSFWIYKCENFINNTYITTEIKIEKNENVSKTYDKLFKYLKTPIFFKKYLILMYDFASNRKYGYYKFINKNIKSVLNDLKNGNTLKTKVTIPEGFNIYQIASTLEKSKIISYYDFINAVTNNKIIVKITGKSYKTLEGFLYPETYFFQYDETPINIIEAMYKEFTNKLPINFTEKVNENGLTFYEGLILASIIQKETYIDAEYPLIASVFYNRLNRHMPLQSDPTVIYGIFQKFNGNLQKKHLKDKNNPYNTYIYKGLPPTPICNPSINALKAVMYPAKTDYLYFVADKNGKHHFSKTYSEHRRKVYKYQILRK